MTFDALLGPLFFTVMPIVVFTPVADVAAAVADTFRFAGVPFKSFTTGLRRMYSCVGVRKANPSSSQRTNDVGAGKFDNTPPTPNEPSGTNVFRSKAVIWLGLRDMGLAFSTNARPKLESGAKGPLAANVPSKFPVPGSRTAPEVRYNRPLSYCRSVEEVEGLGRLTLAATPVASTVKTDNGPV